MAAVKVSRFAQGWLRMLVLLSTRYEVSTFSRYTLVLPPLCSSWILLILELYIALKQMDPYSMGLVPSYTFCGNFLNVAQ